jgi:hypothetical protein
MPLLIGKSAKPRCFNKGFKPSQYVMYRNEKKAWMNTEIFDEWLMGLHKMARVQRKQIVLILDNAPQHALLDGRHVERWPEHPTATTVMQEIMDGLTTWKVTNLRVIFLPPNTTSEIQPLDQGIIRSLKARYRSKLLTWLVAEKNKKGMEDADVSKMKPNLRQTIKWLDNIWKEFPERIVYNCWRRSGLLHQQAANAFLEEPEEMQRERENLQALIDNVGLGEDAMTAQEYIDLRRRRRRMASHQHPRLRRGGPERA